MFRAIAGFCVREIGDDVFLVSEVVVYKKGKKVVRVISPLDIGSSPIGDFWNQSKKRADCWRDYR